MTHQLAGRKVQFGLILLVGTLFLTLGVFQLSARNIEPASLDGTQWVLETIAGDPVLSESAITAEFAAGQIAGSAGVNRYFAPFATTDTGLEIGPAGSTMMMGPENLMAQEMAFLGALQTAVSYELSASGSILTVQTDAGPLTFVAQ